MANRMEICSAAAQCRAASPSGIKYIQSLSNEPAHAVVRIHVSRNDFSNGNWLFVGEVGDNVKIELNEKLIFDPNANDKKRLYFRYLSLFTYVPREFIQAENELSFDIVDLNQTIFGLRSNLQIGTFSEVLLLSVKDFLMRTGSTFLSAFTLFFLSIVSIIAFGFLKDQRLLYLSIYGLISAAYLISFSEVPRSFGNPVLLSGPIHFSLRLLQDLSFCIVLLNVFRNLKKRRTKFALILLYFLACFSLWAIYLRTNSFPEVQKLMFFCAPLVALPSVLALYLTKDLPDLTERTWGLRFFFVLFSLQVNDLFVFWQLVQGYFFVKWYIPLIVLYVFFILLRRASIESREKSIAARLGAEQRQFMHDVRPALAALKVSFAELKSQDARDLARDAINRMETISEAALTFGEKNEFQSIRIFLNSLENLGVFYKRGSNITIDISKKIEDDSLKISVPRDILNRVLQNLLQNSAEANPTGEIRILVLSNRKKITIDLTDSGPGFSKEILAGIGQNKLTQKDNGKGLGLPFCLDAIHHARGTLEIKNARRNGGARVLIELPLTNKIIN